MMTYLLSYLFEYSLFPFRSHYIKQVIGIPELAAGFNVDQPGLRQSTGSLTFFSHDFVSR